jgi:hypothetical protein
MGVLRARQLIQVPRAIVFFGALPNSLNYMWKKNPAIREKKYYFSRVKRN